MKKLSIPICASVLLSALILALLQDRAVDQKKIDDGSASEDSNFETHSTATPSLSASEDPPSPKIRVRPTAEEIAGRKFKAQWDELKEQLEALKNAGLGVAHPNVRQVSKQLSDLEIAYEASLSSSADQVASGSSSEESRPQGFIGVVLDDRPLRVKDVLPDSPAARAGLLPGDILTGVDGASLEGVVIDQAFEMMKGPAGDSIQLTYQRPSSGETRQAMLRRAPLTSR